MTAFLLALSLAFAGNAVKFPASATVNAADGVVLAATWGVPDKATRAVIFLHQYGRNKEDFEFIAEKLYRDGNAVMAIDLRGHGASTKGVPAELTPADYQAMISDVKVAVAQLKAKGITRFCIVGAELGANVGINVAVDEPAVASVVLLSPGLDIRGVIAADAVKRFGARPVLLVASSEDTYAARSSGVLDASAVGKHEYRLLEGAGKGAKMLNAEPALEGWLIGWIGAHWVEVAPTVPLRPTITVDPGTLTSPKSIAPPPTDPK